MDIHQFRALRSQFRNSQLYVEMVNTVEDSPYHREENVAKHTEMVVDQYMDNIDLSKFEECNLYLGAIAALFHDVGKPQAEEPKFSEQRGEYRSYAGHELLSTRMFEDYAVRHKNTLNLTPDEIFKIGWMIQNHLPYRTKKQVKIQHIYDTLHELGIFQPFVTLLMADQRGRVSDNHQEKIVAVSDWICSLMQCNKHERELDEDAPTVTLLIGPSSAGKSTLTQELLKESPDTVVYSWDIFRMTWYRDNKARSLGDHYKAVFEASCNDSEFGAKVNAEFIKLVNQRKRIIVDNTNISAKRRRFYTTEAMKRGYRVKMIVCMISRQDLLNRAESRRDHILPIGVVINMHDNMTYPNYGECHEIIPRFT